LPDSQQVKSKSDHVQKDNLERSESDMEGEKDLEGFLERDEDSESQEGLQESLERIA
jgi:hypothetical protein